MRLLTSIVCVGISLFLAFPAGTLADSDDTSEEETYQYPVAGPERTTSNDARASSTPAMTRLRDHEVLTGWLPRGPFNNSLSLLGPSNVPVAAASACPSSQPWRLDLELTLPEVYEIGDELYKQGYRPISVDAEGSDNPRFNIIWLRDSTGADGLWMLRPEQSALGVDNNSNRNPNCRLVAVDAYGSDPMNLKYITARACDGGPKTRHLLSASREDFLATHEENLDDGFSPIWIDVWFDTDYIDNQFTYFSGIWALDGVDRELSIDLDKSTDTSVEPLWQGKTDNDYRLLRLSEYYEAEPDQDLLSDFLLGNDPVMERRFAAIWTKTDSSCGYIPWEAFRSQIVETVAVKAAAQSHQSLARSVVGIDQSIDITQDDLSRLVQVDSDDSPDPGNSPTEAAFHTITVADGTPANGELLFLSPAPGERILVQDVPFVGNVRLARWNGPAASNANACGPLPSVCGGQTMRLDNWQSRLVLRYAAGSNEWHEVQRNGLSPDFYRPVSTDSAAGRIASVWVAAGDFPAQPTLRRFRAFDGVDPSVLNAASPADQNAHDQLNTQLDNVIQPFMEERLIGNAVVGVSVGGRLVSLRTYAHAWPPAIDADIAAGRSNPDTRYRIASVSKPITAIAIMRLAEESLIDLDQRIDSIPGAVDLLGDNWPEEFYAITPRQLLNHLGGWDRNKPSSPDYPVGQDFGICTAIDPHDLPTDPERIIAYARRLIAIEPGYAIDHRPGEVYAYSNFGYLLLGRLIELVSGSGYETYVRDEVLTPLGMARTLLHPAGPGGQLSGETLYYEPANPMAASVFGIPSSFQHPDREECNRDHADRVPTPYGEFNVRAMDAHGGWLSTASDMLRFTNALDDLNFLPDTWRRQMWSLPTGRETRVYEVSNGPPVNRTFDVVSGASAGASVTPLTILAGEDDSLYISKGLTPFNQIDFTLVSGATAGTTNTGNPLDSSYDLVVQYPSTNGWTALNPEDDNLAGAGTDGLASFTAGTPNTITFDIPDDWEPLRYPAFNDLVPRYYVRIHSDIQPGAAAKASRISVAGPGVGLGKDANYALGWQIASSSNDRFELPVVDLSAPISVGSRIVGAASHATATLQLSASPGDGSIFIQNIIGGSFRPGESLHLQTPGGTVIANVGDDRERPLNDSVSNMSVSHSGKLSGVRTFLKRRSDGIHYVFMINQAETGSSFYLKSHNLSTMNIDSMGAVNNIDTAINGALASSTGLPGWDLFSP